VTQGTEYTACANRSIDPSLVPTRSSVHLSRGVSIKGLVKFLKEMCIDGEVEGQSIPLERSRLESTRSYAVRSERNQ